MSLDKTDISFLRLAVVSFLSLGAAAVVALVAPEVEVSASGYAKSGYIGSEYIESTNARLRDAESESGGLVTLRNAGQPADASFSHKASVFQALIPANSQTQASTASRLNNRAEIETELERQLFIAARLSAAAERSNNAQNPDDQYSHGQLEQNVALQFDPSQFLESTVDDGVINRTKPLWASIRSRSSATDINENLWVAAKAPQRHLGKFDEVGFPHIEQNDRLAQDQYKPYRTLIEIDAYNPEHAIANVRCMGRSPAAVDKRMSKYESRILDLGLRYNVSVSLIKAVITKESCFNPRARSHVGAIGLMQLMPETAKWLKVSDPTDSDQNLKAGIRYLSQLRQRFGSDELALAAYNAGPGNVSRYGGIPPFAETQNYVIDVMHYYRSYVATTRYINDRAALNEAASMRLAFN